MLSYESSWWCPEDWIFVNDIGCFFFGKQNMNHDNSVQYCKNLTSNAGLVEIIDQKTQYFITGVIISDQLYKTQTYFWIGANDKKQVITHLLTT